MALAGKLWSRWQELSTAAKAFSGALLLACLAVAALAGVSLARSREQHRRQAEITAQSLCAVLADDLVTIYEKIDLVLLGVKEDIECQLGSGGLDRPRLESILVRRRAWLPELYALRFVNAEGLVVQGGVPEGLSIDLADREYFLRLKAEPGAGLVFSKPLLGRVTRTWALMLARRINRPDGSFGGIVYGAIDLDKLETRFASLAAGGESLISLRDPGLAVLAWSRSRDLKGQTIVSQEFRALAQAGRTRGTYACVVPVDGVHRISAFLRLQPSGHYLQVGFGTWQVFEPWRREVGKTLGLVGAFFLLIGVTAWVAYRVSRRQQQAEKERERVIQELRGALAEVKALKGLLPICSKCKKIRDDHGYWNQIEAYISSHSDAHFTHGICPECADELFPEVCMRHRAAQE